MKFIPIIQGKVPQGDIVSRFIHPGEFFFCGSNCQIQTILGSCIAITLWHPILHIGGMCHFVLPGRRSSRRKVSADYKHDGRYLDAAMILFEKEASQRGTSLSEYQAKIFGGGNMLSKSMRQKDELVGEINIVAARQQLADKGILLEVAHVGETGHRKIIFDVESGDVWVKHEPLRI